LVTGEKIMRIYEMGDGTLVQLDKKDVEMLRECINELYWWHNGYNKTIINHELIPFLEYLLAETGEVK
jgi:hypothetical protein